MTKPWKGPTPYDADVENALASLEHRRRLGTNLSGSERERFGRLKGLQDGFRAAMNSPEVVAMYEHIAELRDAWERGVISEHDGKGGTRSNRNAELCNAYESGLKETP